MAERYNRRELRAEDMKNVNMGDLEDHPLPCGGAYFCTQTKRPEEVAVDVYSSVFSGAPVVRSADGFDEVETYGFCPYDSPSRVLRTLTSLLNKGEFSLVRCKKGEGIYFVRSAEQNIVPLKEPTPISLSDFVDEDLEEESPANISFTCRDAFYKKGAIPDSVLELIDNGILEVIDYLPNGILVGAASTVRKKSGEVKQVVNFSDLGERARREMNDLVNGGESPGIASQIEENS